MNIVAHNLAAMDAQRQIKITNDRKAKQAERLSSGYRINRSADDAAGLSISEKMRAQIRGLQKGETNEQDGLSLMQVADGALTESIAMMHRLTELSIQSANDTNTPEDRAHLQEEVKELLKEINHISEDTEFNTQKVFPQRIDFSPDTSSGPAVTGSTINVGDIRKLSNSGLSEGRQSVSADSSGISIGGSTETWDNTNLSAVIPGGGTLHVGFRNGIDLNVDVAAGASVSDVTELLNGATFDISYGSAKVSGVGSLTDGSSFYSPGGYSWTAIDDPLEDAIIRKMATEHNVDLNDKPLYMPYGGELSIYPRQKNAFFLEDGAGSQQRFQMDEDALNAWLDGQGDMIHAGDEIPVIFKYSSGGKESKFSLSVIADADVAKDNLFRNMNQGDKFTLRIGGTFSDATLSSSLTLSTGSGSDSSSPLDRATKDWWIQTSSQNMDGFFIQTGAVDTQSLGIDGLDISTREGAEDAIGRVKRATEALAEEKGRIGAQENRLEHATKVTSNIAENTQASESRIRDQDMADSVVDYFRDNVLENVGISMLAQANQSKQGVLSLLQPQG